MIYKYSEGTALRMASYGARTFLWGCEKLHHLKKNAEKKVGDTSVLPMYSKLSFVSI